MSSMLIAFNGTNEIGQFLGDTICSIKTAYLFAQAHPCGKYLLAMSPRHEMNFLWDKFIETYKVQVVYDNFHVGNVEERHTAWDKWRAERQIDGIKFDVYKELYRRIDGAKRQGVLCGGEKGLGRKNIFEYFYYGQENVIPNPPGSCEFDETLIAHTVKAPEHSVFLAPYAKCQGNDMFTFNGPASQNPPKDYWNQVVHRLIDNGIPVTTSYNGGFCEELNGNPLYRKVFSTIPALFEEICNHKLVVCGNTGVGWAAGACGVPLLAMQPVNSNMPDYRYEWCGVKSLIEFLDKPDVDYCVKRIMEEIDRKIVLTTGCFDILHAGHVRHLQMSRGMGSKLIVCLNSDKSVKALKGDERPINKEEDRAEVLKSIRWVDEVRIFDGPNALDIIKEVKPSIITNGLGHKVEEIIGKEFVESYGGRAVITDITTHLSTTGIIRKVIKPIDVLAAIRDALAHSATVNPFNKLKLMADQFLSVSSLPGDVADLGTYRGGCAYVMQRLAPDKNLHVFDTWTGNPFDDPLCHHRKGEWGADLNNVKMLLGQENTTHYHVGIFPETAQKVDGMFCFAFIDPDTYQSVKDAIAFFWPRMVSGGKMMFDDYNWTPCAGVKKAVDEFFDESDRVVYAGSYACVVVKR